MSEQKDPALKLRCLLCHASPKSVGNQNDMISGPRRVCGKAPRCREGGRAEEMEGSSPVSRWNMKVLLSRYGKQSGPMTQSHVLPLISPPPALDIEHTDINHHRK